MNTRRTVLRRIAGATATTGAVGSAAMLLVTILGLSLAGVSPAAAATAGTAVVITPADGTAEGGQPLNAGGSATPFSLKLPTGAACTGDSANSDYRVQGYMVPASVDPNSLTFDFGGPIPGGVGATFRQPLFTSTSSAYVNAQTADNTVPGGPGPIVTIPAFSLGVFSPGNVPPGVYNLGIACTLGTASATQLDKFWNVQITIAEDTGDQPAQVGWTVGGGSSTTTTTAGGSTTTTAGGSTTTSEGGSTTTTEDGTTTTTTDDSTTTTTEAAFVSGGGTPSGTSVGGVTSLPTTGSSTMALVGWSVLLVLCGRAAVLLAASSGATRQDMTVVAAEPRMGRRVRRRDAVAVPELSGRLQVVRASLIVVFVVSLSLVLELVVVSGLQQRAAQQRAYDRFRAELAEGTAPTGPADADGRRLAPGAPVAYLEIPSIGLRQVIGEGTTPGNLFAGPGHRRDSPLPGQVGASVVMARRSAFGGPFARIDDLEAGAVIHVTTGQGEFDYRVTGVREEGDPAPEPIEAGGGRLLLVTAGGQPFMPSGVLRVDADLDAESAAVVGAAPLVATANLPKSEQIMGADASTLWALAFWLQALIVLTLGAVWAWHRWGRAKAWIVFLPPLLLVGLAAAGEAARLMPNLL